jgi:hypothetical protein
MRINNNMASTATENGKEGSSRSQEAEKLLLEIGMIEYEVELRGLEEREKNISSKELNLIRNEKIWIEWKEAADYN